MCSWSHRLMCAGAAAAGALLGCSTDSLVFAPTAPQEPAIPPGELCTPQPELVRLRFEPGWLVLAPGQTRAARLIVDPDLCEPHVVRFASSDGSVAPPPEAGTVKYALAALDLEVAAKALGAATITATLDRGDAAEATAALDLEVLDPALPTCSSADDVTGAQLEAGGSVAGEGSLKGASIRLPEGADRPNSGSFLWSVSPFAADVRCAAELALAGYVALGPAVTFGPEDAAFKRDLPLAIPLNPARLPEHARWRDLRLAYSGPRFKQPRTVPVADAHVRKREGVWVAELKAPRLGTYQAVAREDAGKHTRERRLTHRAVLGVSMGATGAAMVGLRHHHLFDAVAALGGAVDWTWFAYHMEHNHAGGFPSIAPGTELGDIALDRAPCSVDGDCAKGETCVGAIGKPPAGKCARLPAAAEPYLHPSTFNTWWYEFPKDGNGGSFDRRDYVHIFRDISLLFGSPSGYNPLPGGENLPAGVDPDGPSQTGGHEGDECKIWVDPIKGPDHDKQAQIADTCPRDRCKHTQVLHGYYDGKYNPDGSFPVITLCDGSPQRPELTPYADTWSPEGNDYPVEVGLAVDYDGDGVRDEMEPVINAGHEPWHDDGEDGTPSSLEPGYSADNQDPAGDDYDAQYNPAGTEGDHRFEPGESFDDFGLDGVKGTAGSAYDFGEGDGQFTVAPGLQRMWDRDPHSIVRGLATQVPGGELVGEALARLDFWTDGGTRDLFNSVVAAQHVVGAFAARGRDTAYLSDFLEAPGNTATSLSDFQPKNIQFEELPGAMLLRYGKSDPSAEDIASGSGQHVGTTDEMAARLAAALYFIDARWPDAPRSLVAWHPDEPVEVPSVCNAITGKCLLDFKSSFGRTGPVSICLPPGYADPNLQHLRYPVIYMLHGYGQSPEDMTPACLLTDSWANASDDGQATRLGKAIVVYVDGRCRIGADGKAECLRGTFFGDSARAGGAQIESWWLEIIDWVDQNFRTMGETVVSVAD
ncbi:MAG: hypothetical protein HY744_08085 [Deltaproteobacteria bacterium]|nr:hypothetical protein [Deltaproteobacteria bacterium]